MVEPVSMGTLLLTSLAGLGGAAAAGAIGGKGGAAPAPPTPPTPLTPAAQPAPGKPKAGGMQQSFLSGAAAAQLPGAAGGGTGQNAKTLLGS